MLVNKKEKNRCCIVLPLITLTLICIKLSGYERGEK